MKQLITYTLSILICFCLKAQNSGTIKFTSTVKLEFEAPEGIDLGDLIPSEMTTKKELIFSGSESIYKEAKDNVNEDVEIGSDDGSVRMVFRSDETEDILYTNVKEKSTLHQTGFFGKEFLIDEKLEKNKWKITDEKIKYLNYVCQKATMTQKVPPKPGTEEEPTEEQIVAWFTSEIPAFVGPESYNQLPGAVLMVSVNDGKTEIKATEVKLGEITQDQLKKPTKGQRVTNEEYEKIMADKIKEMEQMHGGRGNSIMIRG